MLAFFLLGVLANSDEVLQRVKQRVLEDLAQVPNYTCTETITRSQRKFEAKKFTMQDTIRLEVALVNGGELFAWPGGKFQQIPLEKLVRGGGLVGNGDFAQHLRGVFQADSATFGKGEEVEENGRARVRFSYSVPVSRSTYVLSGGKGMFKVAYHGTVTADAKTHSMVRLEVMTPSNLPEKLMMKSATHVVEYMRVPIGGQEYLLPERGVILVHGADGYLRQNEARFSGCKQYAGESTINFGDPDEVKPREAQRLVKLPAGIEVDVRLTQSVNTDKAAVGEKLPLELLSDVHATDVELPKKAQAVGHITAISKRGRTCVSFGLSAIETPAMRAEFDARVLNIPIAPAFGDVSPNGSICFRIGQHTLPSGMRMSWITK